MSDMRVPDTSKKGKRPQRVAAEILRDLPGILRAHVELPQYAMVSITDVEVSDDLSFASVYFSVIGEHEAELAHRVEQELNAKKGVVRHELAQRLVMRQHPDIRFHHDATPARAARIEELLRQVREQGGASGSGESS
jgi:ribosome-binding factor A